MDYASFPITAYRALDGSGQGKEWKAKAAQEHKGQPRAQPHRRVGEEAKARIQRLLEAKPIHEAKR